MAAIGTGTGAVTANDRLKNGFSNWMWQSVIVATLVHFGVFAFFPTLQAEGTDIVDERIETLDIPPEVEIPPPPQQIARPAMPVVSTTPIDEDITIAPTTFDANPINNLPPPPANATSEDIAAAPVFVPFESPPQLQNARDVQQMLQRRYPVLLRNAGIGGSVLVWFFVDETGRVANTQLKESSGYPTMDEVALDIADEMVFRPATNRDVPVAVWVAIPIDFSIGG